MKMGKTRVLSLQELLCNSCWFTTTFRAFYHFMKKALCSTQRANKRGTTFDSNECAAHLAVSLQITQLQCLFHSCSQPLLTKWPGNSYSLIVCFPHNEWQLSSLHTRNHKLVSESLLRSYLPSCTFPGSLSACELPSLTAYSMYSSSSTLFYR